MDTALYKYSYKWLYLHFFNCTTYRNMLPIQVELFYIYKGVPKSIRTES
jgi:hypothetical protein